MLPTSSLRSMSEGMAIFLQFEALDQPEVEDFVETIKRSKESACGPDGIPYSAYKVHAELSGYALHQTNMELEAEANRMDLYDFNKQFVWMAPKGSYEVDGRALIRTPDTVRTISVVIVLPRLLLVFMPTNLLNPPFSSLPMNKEVSAEAGSCL